MRFYKKSQIVISEDVSTDPKQIRFNQTDEITDSTAYADCGGNSKSFPIGTHAVDLSDITLGKWFYIKSDKVITLSVNGGAALTLYANMPTEMAAQFTSLSITTTEVSRVTIIVAGD